MDYKSILKQYWGYDSFRGIQEDIINSIGSGRDTLGLMPTGGGKSITFQVPALAQPGLCLVVTPLIALMKDQVRNLRDRGIKAIAVYSGMTREEIVVALENCIFGDYKFLYISPERLDTEIFQTKLKSMKVSMITSTNHTVYLSGDMISVQPTSRSQKSENCFQEYQCLLLQLQPRPKW